MATPASRRQKRMGPAPFASFEDLSDELESPDEKNPPLVRLPGIREDVTPTPDQCGISLLGASARLQTPAAPRIDISRASSSSHHDSRESSPEKEGGRLGLGFKEEGAMDLRSSTEELDFQDPQMRRGSGHHQRKDSQGSELGLLCISGRTSRLSSIGSQGSGHSRLSNASRLSVVSGQSRSPSPHKMLLETSFCGAKPQEGEPRTEPTGTKREDEVLEKVLLARKQDPREAVLAEGISVKKKNVQSVKSDITIKVDEPQISNNTPKLPKKIVSESGVEYIYIPLKGPLPVDPDAPKPKPKSATVQSKNKQVPSVNKPKAKSATPSPVTLKKEEQPKYIRIKLKPDYLYKEGELPASHITIDIRKPDSLNLSRKTSPVQKEEPVKVEQNISLSSTPSASPKLPRQTFLKEGVNSKTPSPSLSRKSSFASIFRSKETILSPESPTVPGHRRKNTIGGILREASESLRERSRSRSKSRERDRATLSTAPSSTESIDSSKKQKTVFSKFKKKSIESSSSEVLTSLEGIAKFSESTKRKYQETPLEGDSIRIPLHSPIHYEERSILQEVKTSSQDSQETVIEVCRKVEAIVETVPVESNIERQTSDNVVFSTKLGSNNEIFTTELPKDEAPPPEAAPPPPQINRHSTISSAADDERNSSESERDSEIDFSKSKKDLKLDLDYLEPERKGLVVQQDSYEDELPYVPTTLPQERSAAIPIVPIKQRSTFEMKTCPIERPRSTTPINPSCLEEYCEEVMGNFNSEIVTKTIEKLKISLPKVESIEKPMKSPRKSSNNWFEFAEKGLTGRKSSLTQEELPVKKEWINFEEIPERRKQPKRIQTLPSRGHIDVPDSVDNVVYNYVNPEECKCECHEISGREKADGDGVQEDELPLLDEETNEESERLKVEDRVVSDSSLDLSTAVEPLEVNGVVKLRTPFTSDLGMSSNRSSIISQDEPESPGSPNAFPNKNHKS